MTWEHFCHLHGPGNQGTGSLMERASRTSGIFCVLLPLPLSSPHTPHACTYMCTCACTHTCTLSSCSLQREGKHANRGVEIQREPELGPRGALFSTWD